LRHRSYHPLQYLHRDIPTMPTRRSSDLPEDAEEAVYNYHWWFNIEGEEKVITTQGSYPEVDGEFLRVDTEQVSEGYEPPILDFRSEEHTSELQSRFDFVCRLLLEKKNI